MDKENVRKFFKELDDLQNKYGIYIGADYEYEIDYGWDEESYISGANVYLAYYNSEGFEIKDIDNFIDEEED